MSGAAAEPNFGENVGAFHDRFRTRMGRVNADAGYD